MTTKRLASKCVIVTGAGQGIGAVYARALAAEGRKRMLARFTLRCTVDDLARLYKQVWPGTQRGYRWQIVPLRIAVGSVVGVAIVIRYVVFDALLLPLWDNGWRPWNIFRRILGRNRSTA